MNDQRRSIFHTPELAGLIHEVSDPKDSAHVALSCRDLFHIMTPLIWGRVLNLSQIYRLLPQEHLDADQKKDIADVIPEEGFSRLNFYGQFIEHIEVSDVAKSNFGVPNWEMLFSCVKQHVRLPKLRSLTFCLGRQIGQIKVLPWILPFFVPTLTCLKMDTLLCEPAWFLLLDYAVQKCPQLVTLSIRNVAIGYVSGSIIDLLAVLNTSLGRSSNDELSQTSFAHLSGLRHATFSYNTLTSAGLESLSQLPQLEQLTLTGPVPHANLPHNSFSALRYLSLEFPPNEEELYEVWSTSLTSSVKVFQLDLRHYHWKSKVLSLKLFEILEERIPCLEEFEISDGTGYMELVDHLSAPIEGLFLLSRLPLSRLYIKGVLFQTSKDLTQKLVTAFSSLTVLSIPHLTSTWSELEIFATGMPHLEHLGLAIVTAPLSKDISVSLTNVPRQRASSFRVLELDFFGLRTYDSPLVTWWKWDEGLKCTQYVFSIWPCAKFTPQIYPMTNLPSNKRMRDEWTNIIKLVNLLNQQLAAFEVCNRDEGKDYAAAEIICEKSWKECFCGYADSAESDSAGAHDNNSGFDNEVDRSEYDVGRGGDGVDSGGSSCDSL